ncbi:MAG: hypothetical protein JNM56_40195 [Planctomycetia bacterium]|nr:hypothetical protein [Planctomycetia bacterium]
MEASLFDELQQTIQSAGPAQAIDRLCAQLRERKDYGSLFYAMLLKKRHELGVSPLPTGPSSELPEKVLDDYEEGIRVAGRLVGGLFLEEGNLAQAFSYFKMLNELEPVRAALEKYELPEGQDAQPIIELALHHGAHPRRGFEWVLDRFGICSAITAMGSYLNGSNFPHGTQARDDCLKVLIRALHTQLVQRLHYEITRKEGTAPETQSVTELIAGRDWLFDDDNYHVDVSHLSSVVQMSAPLGKCAELKLLRELCAYGQHLSPQFMGRGDPPFEDTHKDFGHFYDVLDGAQVEEGLAHFRQKAENPDPDEPGNPAAEVLVNLYLSLNRPADALAAARQYLVGADERNLTCPNITELCRKVNDYRTLAEVAKERGDAVNFLAGLIAAKA